MKTDDLINEIKKANKDNNYKRVIMLFDEYKKDSSNNSYELLSIYQNALQKTDMKKEEINVLLKLKNSTINNFYNIRLINLYLDLGENEKAINVINEDDKLKYYLLGKIYFLRGEYKESLKMFKEYLSIKPIDIKFFYSAKNYVDRINNNKNNNSFLEIYYDKFKEQGNRLEPGYIIYSDKIGNRYNILETNLDSHKKTRPYLVWKVNNEHIFVLPLSTSISNNSYVLEKKNYPNLRNNSTVFENFILLKDENITSIVDHLSREDYLSVMRYIYEKILLLNKENRKTEKVFISNYMKRMKIKNNDIIVYRDNGKNIENYYFIISIDDYKYETVPIKKKDNSFIISNRNKVSLNKKKPVYNVIKLSEEDKSNLISQLENAYLIQDLCGKRICTKDKEKFVILHDLKDDYLAVSIPYSSSYTRFKLISKDIEFNIDGEISKEELEKLKYQLEDNIKVKKLCIPGYTNQNTHIKAKKMRYKEKE